MNIERNFLSPWDVRRALVIPENAVTARYSTYEEWGGTPKEVLERLGCEVLYSQYHSLADQLWLVLNRLPDPMPDFMSVIDGEQRETLLAQARGDNEERHIEDAQHEVVASAPLDEEKKP